MVRNLTGKHPSYFESILQLRDCSDEVYDFVEGATKVDDSANNVFK